jgi:DNA-nicking Smr family endonuclease
MSLTGTQYMDDDDQILLKRWAEYVRPYPEKVLARTIGCTERTAKHYRNGTAWPTARHWRLIVRAFGRDVLAAVFDPEINDTLARLNREQAQLEARLDEIRARRRSAAGDLDSFSERRDEASHRSPLDRDLPFDGGRP